MLPHFSPANLGAATAVALVHLQEAAESRMRERFVIDRLTGQTTDSHGRVTDAWQVIYDGPGRVRSYRPHEQNPDVAAATVTVQRPDWHIPAPERMAGLIAAGRVAAWSGPVQAGDRARRLTPGKPEKVVRVAAEHETTEQTGQRLLVDEPTGGVWA